jgi:formamidopyrimidine-DNA glycosylase
MPELPEVETIARALREGGRDGPPVLGRTVCDAQALWARSLATPAPEELAARLTGQRIEEIGRRAKFIVMRLSCDTLIFHLRMSGDLRAELQSAAHQPHDRLIFALDEGLRLVFNDPRKFGRAWLVDEPQRVLGRLGPEPLESAFSAADFHQRLSARRRQLKPLLMDQSFLAGLGNIYTDEALHRAGLHPLSISASLSLEQAARLLDAIRGVLQEGIRRNGASIDWVYRGGDFQNNFSAYQRTGQPCLTCGTPIQRITVGQRGTHFCPVCQTGPLRA